MNAVARPLLRAVVVLATLACAAAAAAPDEPAGPVPTPRLSPAEVVRIQLEALRANDATDRGIAVCFRFASPANKRATGPLARFARMIKDGPYALMLRYRSAELAPVEVRGDAALQRVTLVGPTEVVTYLFVLARQGEADCPGCCPGCWMTEAVLVERVERRLT